MSYEKHQPFSYNNLQIYCSDMQRPRGKQTKKWTNKQKTTKKLFQISSKLLRWKLSCQGVKKMPLHFSAENASVNVQIIIFWNIWNSDFFFQLCNLLITKSSENFDSKIHTEKVI